MPQQPYSHLDSRGDELPGHSEGPQSPRPDEVLQLPQNDALVQISGMPPIRASKLRYYADGNFLERRLPAPRVGTGGFAAALLPRANVWLGQKRSVHERLEKAWSEMVSATGRAPELEPSLADEMPRRPHLDSQGDELPGHSEGPQSPRPDDEDDEIPR